MRTQNKSPVQNIDMGSQPQQDDVLSTYSLQFWTKMVEKIPPDL